MAGLLLKELKIRGLVKRTLIVTPANLSFQWQREMKDKFRENFEVIRSDVLRANYGSEPVAGEEPGHHLGLLGLAHRGRQGEPAAQPLGPHHRGRGAQDERLQRRQEDARLPARRGALEMTDHYLLMTATPHKGDPENFCLFLELLDRDVYGDVKSLEEAMRATRSPVLPAPRQGSPGHLPRPRHRARSRSSSRSARSAPPRSSSTATSTTSTTR